MERLERLERLENLNKPQHSGFRLSICTDEFGSFLLLTLVSREVGLNLWPEVTYREVQLFLQRKYTLHNDLNLETP